MVMAMIVIYKITNILNDKPYVGQTRQPIEKRFLEHSKANSPLGNAMRQCGLENFTIEVIETCETQGERFWIKFLNCTINAVVNVVSVNRERITHGKNRYRKNFA